MKKTICFIMALTAIFCLASCSANSEGDVTVPDGMELLTNDNIDYNFFYPVGWVVDRNDGMVRVHVSDSAPASVSVTTYAFPSEYATLEEYCDKFYKEEIIATYKDVSFDEEYKEASMFGSSSSISTSFTVKVDGDEYKIYQVFSYVGGYIFNLQYCASAETFDAYIGAVNDIVDNIAIK